MKKKKFLVSLLSVLMILAGITTASFADADGIIDEIGKSPNAVVMVTIDNTDCVELKNLEDLKVRLSAEGTDLDVLIPIQDVTAEDEDVMGLWVGVPEARIEDAVMQQLAELQGKIAFKDYEEHPLAFVDELEQILTRINVEVVGLPADHYVVDAQAFVLTNDIIAQVLDIVKEAFEEDYGPFESFSILIEKILADMELTIDDLFDLSGLTPEELAEMGITQEQIDAMKDLITNIDPVLEYLASEEYTGMVIAGASLTCDCPYIEEWTYEIVHQYYTKTADGEFKLVDTVYEGEYDEIWEEYYLEGVEGQVIKASDYMKPEYNGQTYTFMGSYDSWILYDEEYPLEDAKLDEFTLDEDSEYYGMVLRYYIEDDNTAVEPPKDEITPPAGNDNPPAEDQLQTNVPDTNSPKTGDTAPIGLYIGLLVTAVLAVIVLLAYKKRNE